MTDLSKFDPNAAGSPNHNIFSLPFTKEAARVIVLPVPLKLRLAMALVQPCSRTYI